MPDSRLHTRSLSLLLLVGLTFIPAVACSKAESPTAPTPETATPSAQALPVLTFEPDAVSPVGQAGTTRIELEPFLTPLGQSSYMTPLWLQPYLPQRGNQIDNAYGGSIAIRPGG